MSKRTSTGYFVPSTSRDVLGHFIGTFDHEPRIDEGHKPEFTYEDWSHIDRLMYLYLNWNFIPRIRRGDQWRYRDNLPLQNLLATRLFRIRSHEHKVSSIESLLSSLETLGFDLEASRAAFRDFRGPLHCVRCHRDYDPREATADSCSVRHDRRDICDDMPSVEGPCHFEYACCNLKYGGPEPQFMEPISPNPGPCYRGSHTTVISDVRFPYNDEAGRECAKDGCRPVPEKLPDAQLELMDVDSEVCGSANRSDDDDSALHPGNEEHDSEMASDDDENVEEVEEEGEEEEESETEGSEEDEDDETTTGGISTCVLIGLDDSSSDSDDSDYWSDDESVEDIDPNEEDDKEEWQDEVGGLMEERAENGASDRDLEEFEEVEEDEEEEEEEEEEGSSDGYDDDVMDVSAAKPQVVSKPMWNSRPVYIERFEPFRVPTARDILEHYFRNQGSDSFHTSISAMLRQEIHQVDVGALDLLLRSLESIGLDFTPSRQWVHDMKPKLLCARCNEDYDPRQNGPTSCAQRHYRQPEHDKFKHFSHYGTHEWRYPCCTRVMYGSDDGPHGDYKDPDFCFVSWHTSDESRVPSTLRRAIEEGPRPQDLKAYRSGHYDEPVDTASMDVDDLSVEVEEEHVPDRLFKRLRIA